MPGCSTLVLIVRIWLNLFSFTPQLILHQISLNPSTISISVFVFFTTCPTTITVSLTPRIIVLLFLVLFVFDLLLRFLQLSRFFAAVAVVCTGASLPVHVRQFRSSRLRHAGVLKAVALDVGVDTGEVGLVEHGEFLLAVLGRSVWDFVGDAEVEGALEDRGVGYGLDMLECEE